MIQFYLWSVVTAHTKLCSRSCRVTIAAGTARFRHKQCKSLFKIFYKFYLCIAYYSLNSQDNDNGVKHDNYSDLLWSVQASTSLGWLGATLCTGKFTASSNLSSRVNHGNVSFPRENTLVVPRFERMTIQSLSQ